MMSTNNILKPQDGKPVVTPTQDMVIGCYYLTIERPGARGEGKYFADVNEAIMAYEVGEIDLQAKVHVRLTREVDGVPTKKVIETTTGRLIFNQIIPQDLGYVEDVYKRQGDGCAAGTAGRAGPTRPAGRQLGRTADGQGLHCQ